MNRLAARTGFRPGPQLIRPTGPALPTTQAAPAEAQIIPITAARSRPAASSLWLMRAAIVAQRLEALGLAFPAQLARQHAAEIAERPSEAERRASFIRSLEQVATSAEAGARAVPIAERLRREGAMFRFFGGACWMVAGAAVAFSIALWVLP